MKRAILTICLVVLFAVPVRASITGAALGTDTPPPVLGPYTMIGFPADSQAEFALVTSVASPIGGTVDFSAELEHLIAGSSWATWSHGYAGDVYYTNGAMSVTLTLPSNTGAFYLYAEPTPFDTFQITATAQDGTQISQSVTGASGACGYGFWATGGDLISSIGVVCDGADFAVGEFGIARVPEPATMALLGLGSLVLLRKRRA
jgi:hypothetical protein